MISFSELMHCDGRTDRLTFLRNVALLAVGKSAVDLVAINFTPDADTAAVALAWLNPFLLIRPWLQGDMPALICLSSVLFFTALVWNAVHRARDAGWSHWLGLLTAVPFMNIAMTIALAIQARKKRSVWDIV